MIRGVHAMFYSAQAHELRAFLRDKFDFPDTDVGGGWLIFDVAEAEVGVHPSDDAQAHSRAGMHSVSFYCDDIQQTVADLKAKGVEFNNEVADQGYGLVTQFKLPGGVVADLYQPHYVKQTAPRPIVPAAAVQEALDKLRTSKPRRAKPKAARKKKAATKKAAAKKVTRKKSARKKARRR